MATAGVEEDLAVQAARILVTLRNRKLLRWPEWVQKVPVTAVVELRLPPQGYPKRPRSGGRRRGHWRPMTAPMNFDLVTPSASAGSVPCSSGEERERSPAPPRWKERLTSRDELMAERRQDSPAYCSALAGSGSSTSAARKARLRHPLEKVARPSAASVSVSITKEPMKASSPETPLDFGPSAAGSGASSSGDDVPRTSSKRMAAGALGSGGGASSGDEGCSSPDKRARLSSGDGDGAISEPMVQQQTPDDSKKAVKFNFDLNMLPEDEGCPGFC